jgi:hypothetical protein
MSTASRRRRAPCDEHTRMSRGARRYTSAESDREGARRSRRSARGRDGDRSSRPSVRRGWRAQRRTPLDGTWPRWVIAENGSTDRTAVAGKAAQGSRVVGEATDTFHPSRRVRCVMRSVVLDVSIGTPTEPLEVDHATVHRVGVAVELINRPREAWATPLFISSMGGQGI